MKLNEELTKIALGGEMYARLVSSTPEWKGLGDAIGGFGAKGKPSATLDKMRGLLSRENSGTVDRMLGKAPQISPAREHLHDALRGAAKRKAYSVSGATGFGQTLRESGDAL